MNGVINVFKEAGWTSSDVVNKLKGMLHQRKIGHGGTLDPDAEGVLPICAGTATRLFDYINGFHKTYVATVCFGAQTDTMDASGAITQTAEVNLTKEEIDEALKSFLGKIQQIPPMYSALHVNGERLYDLARRGETVELQPREIEIFDIQRVSEFENNRCKIRVTCSKGTYIRVICHDLGQKLGSGAYMEYLLRERAAGLKVENALKISQIQELVDAGNLDFVVPTDEAISFMPKVEFSPEAYKKLCNGNPIDEKFVQKAEKTDGFVRIYCNGEFFGIGEKRQNTFFVKCMLGGNKN
ncbi:MAG: tRNA pseudouridine(55) synthase TruB [Clostridia bacterium]|nr:tRNA pseudouridine(55) synthase TruB [Clostridia bacterium]